MSKKYLITIDVLGKEVQAEVDADNDVEAVHIGLFSVRAAAIVKDCILIEDE